MPLSSESIASPISAESFSASASRVLGVPGDDLAGGERAQQLP